MNTHRKPGPARWGPTRDPARPLVSATCRRWLYGIAAAAAPIATAYGLVTDEQSVLWLNLAGAALFIMAVGNTPSRPAEVTEGATE